MRSGSAPSLSFPYDPLSRRDIRLIAPLAAPSLCRLGEANGTRLSSVTLDRTGCCAMVIWEAVSLMRPPQSGVRSAASCGLDLQTASVGLDQRAGSLHALTGDCISASLFEQQLHRTEEEQESSGREGSGRRLTD